MGRQSKLAPLLAFWRQQPVSGRAGCVLPRTRLALGRLPLVDPAAAARRTVPALATIRGTHIHTRCEAPSGTDGPRSSAEKMGANDCCCGKYNARQGTKIIGVASTVSYKLETLFVVWSRHVPGRALPGPASWRGGGGG